MINLSLKICAGGEGKDACDGEGGAPLVCLDKVRSYFFFAAISYLTIWCFCCFLLFWFVWIRCDLAFWQQHPIWQHGVFIVFCSSGLFGKGAILLFLRSRPFCYSLVFYDLIATSYLTTWCFCFCSKLFLQTRDQYFVVGLVNYGFTCSGSLFHKPDLDCYCKSWFPCQSLEAKHNGMALIIFVP